jgi:sulfate permease
VILTTGARLVTLASIFGLPVPLTQVTSSSIIGIGAAKSGFYIWQKRVVVQMIKVWVVSPVVSLVISYALVALLLKGDLYAFAILASSCLATLGIISLMKTMKEEKNSFSKSEKNQCLIQVKKSFIGRTLS